MVRHNAVFRTDCFIVSQKYLLFKETLQYDRSGWTDFPCVQHDVPWPVTLRRRRYNEPGNHGDLFKDFSHSLWIYIAYVYLSAKGQETVCVWCGFADFITGTNKREESDNGHDSELPAVLLFYLFICKQNKIYNTCLLFISN